MPSINPGPASSSSSNVTASLAPSGPITPYANLPTTGLSVGQLNQTSDHGLCRWNGFVWVPGDFNLKVANKIRSLIAQSQISNPAAAQPLIAPSAWVTATAYAKGMSVINAGNVYTAIVAGTSSAAPTLTTNGPITDGTVQWYYAGPSFSSSALAPTYTPATSSSVVGNAGNFWTNTAGTRTDGAAQIRDTTSFVVTGSLFTETGGTQNTIIGNANALLMTVSFVTDAPSFAIVANGGSSWNSQIYVNGVPLTLAYGSAATISGSVYYHQLVFATRTPRVITFEMNSPLQFYGVLCADKISKVWAASLTNNVRVAITGTSYITGSAVHPVTNSLAWGSLMMKLIGVSDYWQDALGAGSGYIAAGGFGNYSALARFTALVAYNPDVVVVAGGGINDRSQAGITVGIEAAAVTAYLASVRAALPAAMILVIGSEAGATGPAANVFQMEEGCRNGIVALADPNTFFIPQSATTAAKAWMSGTGNASTPNQTGNSDAYISSDGIHPVQAGVLYEAQQSALGFINVFNTLPI